MFVFTIAAFVVAVTNIEYEKEIINTAQIDKMAGEQSAFRAGHAALEK